MDIKGIVKDNTVQLVEVSAGTRLLYCVRVPSEGIDYMFPVPLSDVGDATLLATDKAIVFMRYIRQALRGQNIRQVVVGRHTVIMI